MNKPITIAGGGLAGLSLGISLRKRGVPVRLLEATNYPRHRVCGEFISGLKPSEVEELGIPATFDRAQVHRTTAWFDGARCWFQGSLPEPAYGLSRSALDAALADRFMELGGDLRRGERAEANADGVVWANGRVRQNEGWLGLKAHYQQLELTADLELHAADGGYVGLTRVEDGAVNVCGLFRAPRAVGGDAIVAACESAGLSALAGRLREGEQIAGTLKGVTNFTLGWQRAPEHRVAIGDAAAMIPPFTGNGMSMAIQGALTAAEPLAAWSAGRLSWTETAGRVRGALRKRFARRLRWARFLQWAMMHRPTRRLGLALLSSRVVPFQTLFTQLR